VKVCLATGQFASPYSGVGTYARALATGLRRQGIHVVILCPQEQIEPSSGFTFVPAPAMRLPGHAQWLSHAYAFSRGFSNVRDVDLVHFLDAREALWHVGRRVAAVGTVHDYYFTDPAQYWQHRQRYPDWQLRTAYSLIVRTLERAAYRKVDTLIANSEATNARVSAAYRLSGRLTTIHIGLDLTVISPLPTDRTDSVLFVGGNAYRKGLDRLIRCLPHLTPARTELWVAGTEVPRRLRTLAMTSGVWSRIRQHGAVNADTLATLYRGAKVLALPGVTEAFGLVFMEAMAAGCAVVGPADGGASEFVHDGVNGYLVPYDDDQLLRERLSVLLNDEECRRRMTESAASSLASHTVERMTSKTVQLYRSVLEGWPLRRDEERSP